MLVISFTGVAMAQDKRLSPIRAIMFWSGDYTCKLVKLGMYEYVFKPLDLPLPTSPEAYKRAIDLTFKYVSMAVLFFWDDFIITLKNIEIATPCSSTITIDKPIGYHFWKAASRYYSTAVETVASTKSRDISGHIANVTEPEAIIPSPILDISDLAYLDQALRFIHDLSYRRYHENPASLTRSLVKYMKTATGTPAQNIYVGSFLCSLVKSHKASLAVNLKLRSRPLYGLCLGTKNKDVKHILDTFTVKMCPWCCKPVNVAEKKKSSGGAAHRSHIFTDDYTYELLYCIEKNNRGILTYPLISVGASNETYANDLEWTINSCQIKVFTVVSTASEIKMIINNKKTGATLFTPVAIKKKHCGQCLLCQ